jgi:hypothetical protein
VDAAKPALRLGATESAPQMAGFEKEHDDAYCNAPVGHVEDISEKTADTEVHQVSGLSVTTRSIE